MQWRGSGWNTSSLDIPGSLLFVTCIAPLAVEHIVATHATSQPVSSPRNLFDDLKSTSILVGHFLSPHLPLAFDARI